MYVDSGLGDPLVSRHTPKRGGRVTLFLLQVIMFIYIKSWGGLIDIHLQTPHFSKR
jgi:hypothetical protein